MRKNPRQLCPPHLNPIPESRLKDAERGKRSRKAGKARMKASADQTVGGAMVVSRTAGGMHQHRHPGNPTNQRSRKTSGTKITALVQKTPAFSLFAASATINLAATRESIFDGRKGNSRYAPSSRTPTALARRAMTVTFSTSASDQR